MTALLQRLDFQDRELIISKSRIIRTDKGDFIFREGDAANYLYFIQKGQVRIYKNVSTDKEITIFLRGDQDVFGEIGVFTNRKHSNTAQTMKRSVLYSIRREEIENIFKKNGRIGLQFTRWLSEELETSKAKIRDYLAFGTEGAIASVFIRYSNMYGVVSSEGIWITEPVMLSDVSKHIGASRETVSRIVSKWKEHNILLNNNKKYLIKDINYLRGLVKCDTCAVRNCIL